MSEVELFRAEALHGFAHGFCSRRGGVSSGLVASLNCGLGSGDDPALVLENRRRATNAILPGATLVGMYQVHGANCVTVRDPWSNECRPRADALVSDRPGVLLSLVTADCAPVLLADFSARVIGAAHAGWRGAIGGVTDSAIAAMESLGARRSAIVAAVGPCIAQFRYEVDNAFLARFLAEDRENRRFFAQGPGGKPHFDLSAYVVCRLESAGIAAVERLSFDTYEREEQFYSFRRSVHRGEPAYGRQLSAIALPAG